MRRPPPVPTIDEVVRTLAAHCVTHVGVASAEILGEARRELFRRRELGLHDGMGFTYRDPERSTDPGRAVPEARSIIVAARPYLSEHEPDRPVGPRPQARVAKYAWSDHYAGLRAGLRVVCRRLKSSGHRATAFADDNSIVDRAVAHRAGIGWYGKNSNLLLPGAGSFFVLGSIVTTAVYEPADEPAPDACGSCQRCIDGCPTGAIIEPGVIDARRCLAWVLQKPGTIAEDLRVAIGDRIYGCDDCQDVCPISVRLGTRNTVPLEEGAAPWVDALDLLAMDDDEIAARYGRWYVADRDMRWLRRNALVVIGNCADPDDRPVRRVLDEHRHGGDAILAEHARWALERLDRRLRTGAEATTR